MPAYVPNNFDIGAAAPADSRVVKTTTVERDAIPSGVRFEGLAVYVVLDTITYQLQGGITNSDWVEIAGGSGGADSLINLNDVNINDLEDTEQLLYDGSSSKWVNAPTVFIMDSGTGEVTTNSNTTRITVDAPIYSAGGLYTTGGGRITYINTDDSGIFSIYSQNTTTAEIYPLLSQDADGNVTIAGMEMNATTTGEWALTLSPDEGTEGIIVNVDGWNERGLQINSDADGNVMNVSYQGSNWRTANLSLGTSDVPNHGDSDRDFVSSFDNYHFGVGSHGAHGFKINDYYTEPQIYFQLNAGYGDFNAAYGIEQSATEFTGYVNVIANDGSLTGPVGTGYITAADYIKTDTYFEGDAVFNHNTLVLDDVSEPNYCRVAEVSVAMDEYVTIELDYVLPNSAVGMNKGRVLMQVGFDPDGETTSSSEVEIVTTTDSGFNVDYGTFGTIGILNTNAGSDPPFETGDEIRIPDLITEQLLTVAYLPNLTGVYYNYDILGHVSVDFNDAQDDDILHDVTTTETVITTLPGEAFVTSLFDIKENVTDNSGILWYAYLDNIGPVKTMALFAQLTIEETFMSYIAKYQKEGDPTVTFYDEQDWATEIPTGTSNIEATITTGDSYWNISGSDLYNINSGNVSVGKLTADHKLDVYGDLGVTTGITIQPSSSDPYTTISAPTDSDTALLIESSIVTEDIVNISSVGNVFINNDDNSSTEAKLNVSADSNSTYGLKVQSYGSGYIAARFAGGGNGTTVNCVEFVDYLGSYSAVITGGGSIDANQSMTVMYGTIMSCNDEAFTYQGDNVWTDGYSGDLGDLSDVDLTDIETNSILRFDGTSWVVSPMTSGVTNLDYTTAATYGTITSDTGTDATLPLVDLVNAGLMSSADKIIFDTIESGAQVNIQPDWLQALSTHDAYINNKPTSLSEFSDDIGAVLHIADDDIHVTAADKLSWDSYETNVQADWDTSDVGEDSYIYNKPSFSDAATALIDDEPTDASSNLVTSSGVYDAILENTIDPATGFIRFGDDTLRLTQGSTIINISDVPRLASDGKLLLEQTRAIVGGTTHVYVDTTAVETAITGGLTIPAGDFIFISSTGDANYGMWVAANELTGVAWDMATAIAAFDIIDTTTGASSYTQSEINSAFINNEIIAGDGLTGGGTLAYGGATPTLTVATGNGLEINSTTQVVDIAELVGTPTGTIVTA